MTIQQEITGDAPVALYRLFAATDRLLYVGITDNPSARFAEHSQDKPWWPEVVRKTLAWCDDRAAAVAAEAAAIRDEKPLHNVRGRGRRCSGDRHKCAPIAYRPPEDVRELLALAKQSGRAVNAIITEAVSEYLAKRGG